MRLKTLFLNPPSLGNGKAFLKLRSARNRENRPMHKKQSSGTEALEVGC